MEFDDRIKRLRNLALETWGETDYRGYRYVGLGFSAYSRSTEATAYMKNSPVSPRDMMGARAVITERSLALDESIIQNLILSLKYYIDLAYDNPSKLTDLHTGKPCTPPESLSAT